MKGYNLKLKLPREVYPEYYDLGNRFYNKEKSIYEEYNKTVTITKDKNGELSGKNIMEKWFPPVCADVFISHSHRDIEDIKTLLGVLIDSGYKAFVDSCLWGYADDLLMKLDMSYSKMNNFPLFSYEVRNITTSHVHIMLMNSLMNVMSKSKALIFVNTENSLNFDSTEIEDATTSPWIYSEIELSRILISKQKIKKAFTESAIPKINYQVNLNHLQDIDFSQFLYDCYNNRLFDSLNIE